MAPSTSNLKVFTRAEVEKHNRSETLWMVFNDKVYDFTTFAMEHPGGEDLLYAQGGLDITDAFNDVGHTRDALEMAEQYLIGRVPDDECNCAPEADADTNKTAPWSEKFFRPTWTNVLISVGVLIVSYATYRTTSKLLARL